MAAVLYEKDGRMAIMTLNRPEALNAQNFELTQGLQDAMVDFRDDPDLWVAIIAGAGDRAFSAGADIKGFQPASDAEVKAAQARAKEPPVRADTIMKPFIAAIHGYALGGGLELAMTCDIRIAAEDAQMGQPEINIGFMPGAGGTIRLPRFIPRAIAAEMLLTGNRISAEEALRYGLISRVVPRDQLMKTAKEIALTICERGPLGVRASKEALLKGYDMPMEDALMLERKLNTEIRKSEDFMEGARAFAEKRPPQYKGK
jgi:enoyl-CoA hydratase/carnithine racemase